MSLFPERAYSERLSLANRLQQAMEFWDRQADDMQWRILNNPVDALSNWMDVYRRSRENAQILREWIRELDVDDRELRAFGLAYYERLKRSL